MNADALIGRFLSSLRARVTLALLIVAGLGATGMIAIAEADRLSASDVLEDTSLATQAQDMIGGLRFDRAGRLLSVTSPPRWRRAYRSPGAAYYTLYDPAGLPAARSDNLAAPLPLSPLPSGAVRSPITVVGPNQDLQVVSRAPHGYELVVQRSNPGAFNEASLSSLADFLPAAMFTVVFALGVLAVWLMTDWSLKPLRRASREAALIGPDAPTRRLTLEGLPSEVRPLAEAVNGALDRVAGAYAAEKRFTADAAHALRTPVAVMDLRLQRAAATGVLDPATLKMDLEEIARMIGGLLNLAHAEHGSGATRSTVNLARLLREQAAALQPMLEEHDRAIVVEAPDQLDVAGDPRALRDMINALLENAIQHGAGSITARAALSNAEILLEVEDQGEGVPAAEWTHVFDRFRKLDGASPGAGLGLAVVQQIAVGLGGEARFVAPTQVRVRLPL